MKSKVTLLLAALVAAGGLALGPASADDTLLAGAAVADITPENGRNFFGYVRPDISSDGVALRLFARALVLERADEKLAIVSVDYGSAGDKGSLVARLADRGFTSGNLLFAATHTHAGPDVAFGYDDFALEQIARAVRAADDAKQPARLGWGSAHLNDASRNRSIEAHLADHGLDLIKGQGHPELDPDGVEHTIDPGLHLLRVETTEGDPIGAWTNFSAHPTTFIPANHFYSADYPGVAALRFAERFPRGEAPVTLFAVGNHGDQAAIFDEYNQHAVADRTGQRVAKAMRDAWDDAEDALSAAVMLDQAWESYCFCGQDAGPGEPTSPVGFWGAAFFGGSEDGASIFYEPLQTEGRRRPAELADPIHGRKIIAAPAPFSPQVELQVLRIADRMLMAVPGEPTVEMGRRIRAAARATAPEGVAEALLVGLATQYAGYFTTPEEFDAQHYEGGHTIFGKWSGNLLRRALVDVIGGLGGEPTGNAGSGSTAEGEPWTGDGGTEGEWIEQPNTTERFEVIAMRWRGGPDGRDRPLDAPFLLLERDGEVVDSDLGYRWVWRESDGEYEARYDVAEDLEPGDYTVRIVSARYELTAPVTIVPSDGLIIRGVTAARKGSGDTELRFVAQNPPPDPERNLVARDRSPNGGTVTFTYEGATYTASWEGPKRGWVATVPGDATSGVVSVGDAALVDRHGNTSGAGGSFMIGEVADLIWPSPIGPGGGRTPGFGGEGHFPP